MPAIRTLPFWDGVILDCRRFRSHSPADCLVEVRFESGEIFSFNRLEALFAMTPDATAASTAAVEFGQEDDISVLTLRRVHCGV
jgi:hypothetical protein